MKVDEFLYAPTETNHHLLPSSSNVPAPGMLPELPPAHGTCDDPPLVCFSDGTHWVVARDAVDARQLAEQALGDPLEDPQPFVPMPDDAPLAVWIDGPEIAPAQCACATYARTTERELSTPNGHHPACAVAHPTRPVRAWINLHGRGLLASTEW